MNTVLSYPDRGTGGDAHWRGNHSPRLSEDLFAWLKPARVFDPVCGSGTTGDVAKAMGISCWQGDLHSGFNILRDEFPGLADLVFFHDPYHDIIQYSGNVWGKQPHPDDLSRCPDYVTFIRKMDVAPLQRLPGSTPWRPSGDPGRGRKTQGCALSPAA